MTEGDRERHSSILTQTERERERERERGREREREREIKKGEGGESNSKDKHTRTVLRAHTHASTHARTNAPVPYAAAAANLPPYPPPPKSPAASSPPRALLLQLLTLLHPPASEAARGGRANSRSAEADGNSSRKGTMARERSAQEGNNKDKEMIGQNEQAMSLCNQDNQNAWILMHNSAQADKLRQCHHLNIKFQPPSLAHLQPQDIRCRMEQVKIEQGRAGEGEMWGGANVRYVEIYTYCDIETHTNRPKHMHTHKARPDIRNVSSEREGGA